MILNSGKTTSFINPPSSLTAYLLNDSSIAEPGDTDFTDKIQNTSPKTTANAENPTSGTNSKSYTFQFSPGNPGTYSSILLCNGDYDTVNKNNAFAKLTFAPVVKTTTNTLTFTYTFYY